MSDVVRVGKVDSAMMVATAVSGDSLIYDHVEINATTYACTGCGLVWGRKWYAETCEERKHATKFPQHYGWTMNAYGKYFPKDTYIRKAIARDTRLAKVPA
jgi:hypothetical protein